MNLGPRYASIARVSTVDIYFFLARVVRRIHVIKDERTDAVDLERRRRSRQEKVAHVSRQRGVSGGWSQEVEAFSEPTTETPYGPQCGVDDSDQG